jgi:hypothetical protein
LGLFQPVWPIWAASGYQPAAMTTRVAPTAPPEDGVTEGVRSPRHLGAIQHKVGMQNSNVIHAIVPRLTQLLNQRALPWALV